MAQEDINYQPQVISWNLTRRCNLLCGHCYLPSSDRRHGGDRELSRRDCLHVIDELSQLAQGAVLILTGGEPLIREDIFEIASYAASQGFLTTLATNGTLLSPQALERLRDGGISGVGVSLDSLEAGYHDRFRGTPGAWQQTVAALERLKGASLPFILQATVTKENFDQIAGLADFAWQAGARVFNAFFLVCTGRGEEMSNLSAVQYEQALQTLAALAEAYQGRMLIRAKCAPHYFRILLERGKRLEDVQFQGRGCPAGFSYCRVTPEGLVTPCPYLPRPLGDLRKESFREIWLGSEMLAQLRQWSLKGRCGQCEYKLACGGCRARVLATTGDLEGEDAWCSYQPAGGPVVAVRQETVLSFLPWREDAQERLNRIPAFVRAMVKRRVEEYARAQGVASVTLALFLQARDNIAPSFLKFAGVHKNRNP